MEVLHLRMMSVAIVQRRTNHVRGLSLESYFDNQPESRSSRRITTSGALLKYSLASIGLNSIKMWNKARFGARSEAMMESPLSSITTAGWHLHLLSGLHRGRGGSGRTAIP